MHIYILDHNYARQGLARTCIWACVCVYVCVSAGVGVGLGLWLRTGWQFTSWKWKVGMQACKCAQVGVCVCVSVGDGWGPLIEDWGLQRWSPGEKAQLDISTKDIYQPERDKWRITNTARNETNMPSVNRRNAYAPLNDIVYIVRRRHENVFPCTGVRGKCQLWADCFVMWGWRSVSKWAPQNLNYIFGKPLPGTSVLRNVLAPAK